MRLTAATPSFQRPTVPAALLPAMEAARTPARVPEQPALDRRVPRPTPLSIEEFVLFARNAGAL